jgi:hypothetical protein
LTATGLIIANGGITVPTGQSIAAQGTLTATGLITANAGITIPSGKDMTAQGTITATGAIAANGGITVPSGKDVTAQGTITATGAITANGGITVPSGKDVTAQGSLTVSGASTFGGAFKVTATDLQLDNTTRRGTRSSGSRRAMVHETDDSLSLNYAGDYTKGIRLNGQTLLQGPMMAYDNTIYLRSPGDHTHGLAYFGYGRTFAGASPDGPALYGFAGGVLGTIRQAALGVEGSLVLSGGSSSGGYVTLPSMTDNFSTGITVEAWIYLSTNSNSYARIIDFGNGAATSNVLFCQVGTSTTLRIDIYNGTSHFVADATGVLTTGAWMHVAATADTSGNIKLYKNGVSQTLVLSGTFGLPASTTRTYCYIGKSNWSSDQFWGGKLAHVKLWTRALTADEVSDIVTDSRVVSPTSLAD